MCVCAHARACVCVFNKLYSSGWCLTINLMVHSGGRSGKKKKWSGHIVKSRSRRVLFLSLLFSEQQSLNFILKALGSHWRSPIWKVTWLILHFVMGIMIAVLRKTRGGQDWKQGDILEGMQEFRLKVMSVDVRHWLQGWEEGNRYEF